MHQDIENKDYPKIINFDKKNCVKGEGSLKISQSYGNMMQWL
jgi:hypothetical protein